MPTDDRDRDQRYLGPEIRSEYRMVYNWGQSITEICEVWFCGDDEKPYSYAPAHDVATGDDDASVGEAETPEERLRDRLQAMLTACDKPVLRFPEDFGD